MALIYLVTSGQYSDYGVDAVFSTREAAVAFAAEVREPSYEARVVEVYTLDDPTGATSSHRRPWRVQLYYATGDAIEAKAEQHWYLDETVDEEDKAWVGPNTYFDGPNGPTRFVVTVMAETEEQAIKAANERRVQHKALAIPQTASPST